ncbi:MAG TPA: ATP-binding protein [Solimonas sp.]|nr:ATP-binding protein [Solimonas sp.]
MLILAPTGRDALNTHAILGKAGLSSMICRDMAQLCAEVAAGAAGALVTEEALATEAAAELIKLLSAQPPWSDFPLIVLTRSGPDSPAAIRAMRTLGNVVLLERPVRVSTCVTAARTAVRTRARQYQLRALLGELRDSDRRKDEFLAMLAHELRNPLAPIRNAVQVLKLCGPQDESLQRAGQIVDRQVGHLARLVDDLLDVSRITRGKVELKRERLALDAVIASAVETSRPLIDQRHQLLAIRHCEKPAFVDGDMTRLAQVISNLLNNASKFTPDGGHIWLDCTVDAAFATVRVRDDGIGIAPAMLPRVFDLFVQADSSLERSSGGLGIGLTLVRRLVELHGGSVSVDSGGAERGAEFAVRLPRAGAPAAAALSHKPAVDGAGGTSRILVVDDNVDAADTMAMLLGESGHEVRRAYDGLSALELADTFCPEVIILDIGLPGISGYDVARRIRACPGGAATMLLALSGYARSEDRDCARDAGFDHYLIKPVEFDVLQALVARKRAPVQVAALA